MLGGTIPNSTFIGVIDINCPQCLHWSYLDLIQMQTVVWDQGIGCCGLVRKAVRKAVKVNIDINVWNTISYSHGSTIQDYTLVIRDNFKVFTTVCFRFPEPSTNFPWSSSKCYLWEMVKSLGKLKTN